MGEVAASAVDAGQLEELARMASESWHRDGQPAFCHDAAALRALIGEPPEALELSATLSCEGAPVALTIGLPRQAFVLGRPCRLSLLTELVVASDRQGRGLGRSVVRAALDRARERGRDGALWYAVPDGPAERALRAAARAGGEEPQRIAEVSFLRGLLAPAAGSCRDDGPDLAAEVVAKAWARRASPADVARSGDAAAAGVFVRRPGTIRTAWSRAGRSGAVVGRLLPVADRDRTPCFVVDESCWGGLEAEERLGLARAALERAAAAGARLCSVALLCEDPAPWRAAGLRLSPRKMNAWMVWFGAALPRRPASLLFDVS